MTANKTTVRKLALKMERLRQLSNADLKRAAGGTVWNANKLRDPSPQFPR